MSRSLQISLHASFSRYVANRLFFFLVPVIKTNILSDSNVKLLPQRKLLSESEEKAWRGSFAFEFLDSQSMEMMSLKS
ncbi:hypothetical protein Syun_020612 [Stephania yunnanensis]|uniref:Uncharacterized protein n=1 Tax=Stephania yunnanensis TaxID=152371 RepID=A0AAP0NQ65_9MAGN